MQMARSDGNKYEEKPFFIQCYHLVIHTEGQGRVVSTLASYSEVLASNRDKRFGYSTLIKAFRIVPQSL
jgi:hypothetical protein